MSTLSPVATNKRGVDSSSVLGWLRDNARDWLPVVVLVALVLVIGFAEPSILRPRSLGTIVKIAAPLVVLAAAQTFPILTGGIDLSQAALTSLGTVLLAMTLGNLGALGIPVTLLFLTAAGALNGAIAAFAQIPTFIVTLGTLSFWGAFAMVISGATTIPISAGHEYLSWLNKPVIGVIPVSSILAVLFVVGAALMIRYLVRGRAFHLLGLGEGAARLGGLRTGMVRIAALSISGLAAGIAAMMLSGAQHSGSPTLAKDLLLPVIAAVVLGGTAITGGIGGPMRSLIGALTISVLRVGLGIAGVDPAFEQIAYGVVIIVAVLFTIDRKRILIVK